MIKTRHVGVYGICMFDNQILLVKKTRGPYVHTWDLPGGGLEHGETPEDALKREFLEETTFHIKSSELITVESTTIEYHNDKCEDESLHHVGMLYCVEIDHEHTDAIHIDDEDVSECKWFMIDELPRKMTPFAAMTLPQILND